jgi:hypothetical protein
MNHKEFDEFRWGVNIYVEHKGIIKYVIAVDFEERLLALVFDRRYCPTEEWEWVRCENVEVCDD